MVADMGYNGRFLTLGKTLGGRAIIPIYDSLWLYAPELIPLVGEGNWDWFTKEDSLVKLEAAISLSEEIALDVAASRLAGLLPWWKP